MENKVTQELKFTISISDNGYVTYVVDQTFKNSKDTKYVGGVCGETCDTVEAFNEFLAKINAYYRVVV